MLRFLYILCFSGYVMTIQLQAAEMHRQRADLLTRYIQNKFWDEKEGTYLDKWPRTDEGLPYSTMWGLGIEFSALSSGVRYDPATYRPLMDKFFDGLERYMNKDKKMYSAYMGGTMDIYYDDNHWMVLDYIEAYEITKSSRYLDKAVEIADACLGGVDNVFGGGSYWHIDTKKYPTKNTCANGPLATSLLRLSRHVKDPARKKLYLERGKEIVAWLEKTLQGEDGIMWDNVNIQTGKKNSDWKFTYNTALVIQAHLELYRIDKDRKHLDEAVRLCKAAKFWLHSNSSVDGDHRYQDAAFFTVHLIEALLGTYDIVKDPEMLDNCRKTADYYWRIWRQDSRSKLIDISAVARMQWLLVKYDGKQVSIQKRRFVRVELPKKGTLTLAEVKVFSGDRNIARTGCALQCSDFLDYYANLAIDGNTDGRFGAKSMAHAGENEDNPWWEVEVNPEGRINRICVWNRTDAVIDRIDGARVLILDEKRKPTWEGVVDHTPRPSIEFTITQ